MRCSDVINPAYEGVAGFLNQTLNSMSMLQARLAHWGRLHIVGGCLRYLDHLLLPLLRRRSVACLIAYYGILGMSLEMN